MKKDETVVSLPYHQLAFAILHEKYHDEISYGLTQKYSALRRNLVLKEFSPTEVIDPAKAWSFAKNALDIIENEMAQIVKRRSAAYWLHIYRRIGVFLSPEHENKTDSVTLGLVREIAELAIQKHALSNTSNEIARSGNPPIFHGVRL
jgi:hypothetical protein